MSDLAQRIASLPPEKRALLEQRLLNANGASTGPPAIRRRGAAAPCPLSFAQQRMWFFEQFEPGSPVYSLPVTVKLAGPLQVAALEQALNEIVRRHESLRTTFTAVDGRPLQIIAPAQTVPLQRIDLRGLPPAEREAEARQRITEEVRRPFDLTRGPLLRATVLQHDDEDHTFLLVIHHIISDGWSLGVLFRELGTVYRAFAAGRASPLPELPIQYADFALWQREWLQGERLAEQLAYWKQQLDGAAPALDFPTDHPRPAVQSFHGARQSLLLPLTLARSLKELSRQAGATLFMTLLAAFQVLLSRYGGQDDLVVGTPISGRDRPVTEGLIGLFVNTLALRTDLSGDPTFSELLERVRQVSLGAFAHAALPFEKLVEELQPERDTSRQPLFQAWFRLQNFPPLALALSEEAPVPVVGLTELLVDPLDLDRGTAVVDLSLTMVMWQEELQARLEYLSDLFETERMTRLLRHYQTLLESIVADPGQRLSQLALLAPAERRQLLVEWNDTGTDYPREHCIHALFEAQARRAPHSLALVWDGGQCTYRELDERANQLARYLQARGTGRESLVGICLEPSPELIVSLLAVLKAGGAYVPLDPAYPPERLALLLENARAQVVLTQRRLRGHLPPSGGRVVCLDSEAPAIAREATAPLVSSASAGGLAYMIYTSGSTGRPKGVAVPHRAVVRLVAETNYVQLEPSDRIAQVSNPAFDAATFEIWGALLTGARLVLVPREVALSPGALAAAIQREGITTLFLTTALFNQLVAAAPGAFRSLRHLFFGGEAADPRRVRELLRAGPPQRLVHVYGPTECTTFSSWHVVEQLPADATTVPIGRPLANGQLYLLDRYFQPVPVGVTGELYIGGDGLARGYLNEPGLTAERFVPHPFSTAPGARLYRTGDQARCLPDGNLVFLGRRDEQVKVRGFRIEPGEIEAVLSEHPAVRECVVMAREDIPGDTRLVAYIVRDEGRGMRDESERPSSSLVPHPSSLGTELRSFLQQKLPDHMVPAAFVVLERLPLSPNGKVDRAALPRPSGGCQDGERALVRPRDALEEQLGRIWREVLDIRRLGVTDNFFDVGGHSLAAVRLLAAIEVVWGHQLPLAVFFRAPTVEKMAAIMREEGWYADWSPLVPIQTRGSRPPLFCLHPLSGQVICFRALVPYLGEEQPVYAIQALWLDERMGSGTRMEDLAARYLQEVRAVQPSGPYSLIGFSFGGALAYEMAQQLDRQGERTAFLGMIDSGIGSWRYPGSKGQQEALRRRILRRLAPRETLRYAVAATRKGRKELAGVIGRAAGSLRRSPEQPAAHSPRRIHLINMEAFRKYEPQPYPGRITYYTANEQPRVAEEDPTVLWGRLARGGVEIHRIPGNHDSILAEPDVRLLAEELRRSLQRARAAAEIRPD